MRYIYRKIAEQLETDLKEKAAFFAEETENNCGCRLFLISLKRRNFDADVAALAGEMLKIVIDDNGIRIEFERNKADRDGIVNVTDAKREGFEISHSKIYLNLGIDTPIKTVESKVKFILTGIELFLYEKQIEKRKRDFYNARKYLIDSGQCEIDYKLKSHLSNMIIDDMVNMMLQIKKQGLKIRNYRELSKLSSECWKVLDSYDNMYKNSRIYKIMFDCMAIGDYTAFDNIFFKHKRINSGTVLYILYYAEKSFSCFNYDLHCRQIIVFERLFLKGMLRYIRDAELSLKDFKKRGENLSEQLKKYIRTQK